MSCRIYNPKRPNISICNADYCCRSELKVENPYIHIVWIVAVGNELKVANPDNIPPYFDAILSKIKQ